MKGVSGLFFKPICGGIDFTAKAAEGVKNTVTYFDDKPSNERIRRIRAFYGVDQYYKQFNEVDSRVIELFQGDFAKGKFKDEKFICAFISRNFIVPQDAVASTTTAVTATTSAAEMSRPREFEEEIIAITLGYVIKIDGKRMKLIEDIQTKDITHIHEKNTIIELHMHSSSRADVTSHSTH